MNFGTFNIIATNHYLQFHADVDWDLVVRTIHSPVKIHPNKRLGKDRYTYIKRFKKFIIEVHVRIDESELNIFIINAFKVMR